MAQDIESLLAALRGDGLSKAADEISAKIASGAKLSNAALKALSNARAKNNKEMDAALKRIRAYEEDSQSMTAVDKEDFELQQKIYDQRVKSNKQIGVVTESTEKLSKTTEGYSKTQSNTINSTKNLINTLGEEVSMLGLLDKAISGIEFLYNTWFETQREFTQAMGAATRQGGLATSQVEDLDAAAGNMRSTFQTLGGSLIGWADSIQFVSEAQQAFRMNIGNMSSEFQTEILATERGLGMSAQQTAQLFRSLQTGISDGNESLGDFTLGLRAFAADIGANSNQLAASFIASSDSLQRFGRDGSRVFRETSLFANRFGLETERVLQIAQRFDRFGAASENVNQLNAMFGTTISSLELMQTRDPVARIELITQAVRDQGIAWNDMDFAQQQSIATTLGVTETEAARLIQGADMADIMRDQQERQESAEALARRQVNAQETLFGIIESTSTVFRSWRESLQIIFIAVSDALAPIFETIHGSSQGIARSIADWVREIAANPDFQRTIRNIAEWIADLPNNIRDFLPTWERMRDTAVEMWPVVQTIGSVLMDIFEFAVEHPEAIAIALGVAAAIQLGASVGAMATLFSPTGALMVGIAAFGVMMADAAGAAGRMADDTARTNEILASGGQLTSNEQNARDERRFGSLAALSGDTADRGLGGAGNRSGIQSLGRIGAGGFARALQFVGADSGANRLGSSLAAQDLLAEGNYRDLARTALENGASVGQIVGTMLGSLENNPDNEIYMRRSFGLSPDEDLMAGLMRELGPMGQQANPASEIIPTSASDASVGTAPPLNQASAIETAPVTSRTASVPSSAAGQQAVQIVASDVNIDGHLVGRVMFQISRRA